MNIHFVYNKYEDIHTIALDNVHCLIELLTRNGIYIQMRQCPELFVPCGSYVASSHGLITLNDSCFCTYNFAIRRIVGLIKTFCVLFEVELF